MDQHDNQIFQDYRADFVKKLKTDTVIHHLRNKGVLSGAIEEELPRPKTILGKFWRWMNT